MILIMCIYDTGEYFPGKVFIKFPKDPETTKNKESLKQKLDINKTVISFMLKINCSESFRKASRRFHD